MPAKTVTESPNVDTLTGTVGFNRKVSVRQYESAEASMFVQFDIPTDPDLSADDRTAQIIANARAAFFQAKALVYEELGLEFSVDDKGIVREALGKHFGKVTEVTTTTSGDSSSKQMSPPSSAPAAVAATTDGPPHPTDTRDRDQKAANKAWAMADIAANPENWYDNRENKRSDKSPDYKHKTNGLAVWL